MLGWTLDELFAQTLDAMKQVAMKQVDVVK